VSVGCSSATTVNAVEEGMEVQLTKRINGKTRRAGFHGVSRMALYLVSMARENFHP
jgi:hypothetical protein